MRRTRHEFVAGALVCVAVGAVLAGCSALPAPGPSSDDINAAQSANPAKAAYVLVELTPDVLAHVGAPAGISGFAGVFSDRRGTPTLRLGRGDTVTVTIFEASSGGLFIPKEAGSRSGNFVDLPVQEVDNNGNIAVPYAGQIRAAGRTISEVQAEIEDKLKNRAIEPQVVLAVRDQRSSRVTVGGEVREPIVFNLSAAGERVLDAIARAGGSEYQGFETFVSLQRGGKTASVYYDKLVSQPANNIWLQPGDTLNIYRDSRTFVALGATGQSRDGIDSRLRFEDETLTMAEAIARAGGIMNERGDPKAVFVYRMEPKEQVAKMGYDTAPFLSATVPVIYKVDLRDPGGLFLAGRFFIQDQDMLYIANAASVEVTKLLEIFRLGVGAARDANFLRREFRDN